MRPTSNRLATDVVHTWNARYAEITANDFNEDQSIAIRLTARERKIARSNLPRSDHSSRHRELRVPTSLDIPLLLKLRGETIDHCAG